MSETRRELLTQVLRACAQFAPQPLYPAKFTQEYGVDRGVLDGVLDELRLAGLVELTPWVKDLGQGYAITPAGLQALQQPAGIQRARATAQARPASPADWDDTAMDQGERIRDALLNAGRPYVSRALIIVNVLLFGVGMLLAEWHGEQARKAGATRDQSSAFTFFNGEQGAGFNTGRVLSEMGSLMPAQVLEGHQWWRLLTYAFLHLGILHIACNMYFLWSLGPMIEAMWGRLRFLLLYLVAAITGGCVVAWVDRAGAVGAWGALSGLLGSLGVWTYLNRAHLPPQLLGGLTRMVSVNLVLLFLISLMAGVSWEGHLGGAVGGALVSYPLNVSRFGQSWQARALGFVGVVAVPVVFTVLAVYRDALGR